MTKVEKITVGIRADGNKDIGMGHLMRCISIAYELQEQGAGCIFYTAEPEAGKFLQEKGLECCVLHTDYRDMEAELDLIIPMLREISCDLMLIDSYRITSKYIDKLRRECPVFYLDDMGTSCLTADGIINYNIYGQELGYEDWCEPETQLLLGAAYAPVKKPFRQTAYEVRDKVYRILITMGGSDALNISGQIADCLLQVPDKDAEIDIVCGRFNPHLNNLRALAEREKRIHIFVDVADMWNKMQKADIAISAAGSTMYELSAMGVPTVCCYYVENQRRIAQGFAEKVQMINAGDFTADAENVLKRISQEVSRLYDSAEEREKLSMRMKKVADGFGAERIAWALGQAALQRKKP